MDLSARIDSGTAELLADPRQDGCWTLVVNGVAQSHVDLYDPLRLDMMYTRMIASILDVIAAPREPLRALHLGGGGMTLPRYLAASRPNSAQLVIERDRPLIEFLHFGLPLPPDCGIAVQHDDARAAVESGADNSFDVVITDAYRGAVMPARVSDTGFVAETARLLAPGGVYIVNVLDAAGLVLTKRQLATVRTAYTDTALLSTPAMWKGRRDGNVVIVAAAESETLPLDRITAAARPRLNLSLKHGPDLDRFLSGTAPVTS
ncbi:hypothetical protein Snas_4795 [Stackebrandtia nassauensis DSM 44728]|uniref:Spermidine synthase-like protein n=2 Tax=Stackebrandtia TaxID=283810 RepID=D3Q8J4_STANL|nr:hypothetical protein Snas_4795 [Stackebrandtia nassauensis DSM 44728]